MKSTTIIFALVILAITFALAACAGMNIGDIVQTKTPTAVQQHVGLPAKLSLNEAEVEYQAYFADTQRNLAQWKGNIEQANELRGLLSQLTLQGLDAVGPAIAGIPVAGPSLFAFTAFASYFLGTGKLRKEKEASYNAGIEKATEIVPIAKT